MASLAAVVLAFGLLWQARAYLATGNPFSPANTGDAVHGRQRRPPRRRLTRAVEALYSAHFRGKANFQSPTQNPAGIVLLLLAPLWLIRRAQSATSKTETNTETVLWLFVILYYPLWSVEAAVLRYAIAPVLVLTVLGAARLALFPKPLAITAMGAALLFSFPVVILIEMAPAQIPLFLKQIDAATFLRRTLPPYGAVDFLNQHATASDRIASIGDWVAAYTPNPANFHVLYFNERIYQPSSVLRILGPDDRYLILPVRPNLAQLESAVRQAYRLTRLYRDHDFAVDAVQPESH